MVNIIRYIMQVISKTRVDKHARKVKNVHKNIREISTLITNSEQVKLSLIMYK